MQKLPAKAKDEKNIAQKGIRGIKVNESRYRRCGVTPRFRKTKKQLTKFC